MFPVVEAVSSPSATSQASPSSVVGEVGGDLLGVGAGRTNTQAQGGEQGEGEHGQQPGHGAPVGGRDGDGPRLLARGGGRRRRGRHQLWVPP